MTKFLAVLKREYLQRVRSRMFLATTILGPLVMSLFGLVPALMLNMEVGGPVRIAVVDQTGKLFDRVNESLMSDKDEETERANDPTTRVPMDSAERMQQAADRQRQTFWLQKVVASDASLEQTREELRRRIRNKELDLYLILPADILESGSAELVGSSTGDIFSKGQLKNAVSNAVRGARLEEARIDAQTVRILSRTTELKSVRLDDRGETEDSGQGFLVVFGVGFTIYLTILMYGQMVLGAVIEEKETRIAEVLFASVRPFTLMVGKLIGVSCVALTQLAIWGLAFITFVGLGTNALTWRGVPMRLPGIRPLLFVYFALFFLLGYFIYATVYALVGSMVTTPQEGAQLAMPIILLLVVAFYLAFPVIKSPNSQFAFWVSIIPFFASITMLVRIVAQTPPFWQIALALLLQVATILGLLWIAARIYRIGMLMYGKKATIPEIVRWVRQT
ncbi:MAG TPA: ABC transporter permease [Pyrinomonadaceae bacterium]|nr:ABC transporter permease [Pyrinomonadaceae bacterium]